MLLSGTFMGKGLCYIKDIKNTVPTDMEWKQNMITS